MLLVISPAKNIQFEVSVPPIEISEISFEKESKTLLKQLKKLSIREISDLMKISNNLAQLNFERFQSLSFPMDKEVVKPSVFVFNGDVFKGMDISNYSLEDLHFANKKLRILSGLYGVLKPFDGILPYRLEMGTPLKVADKKNLYEFWGDKLREKIQSDMDSIGDQTLINLASNEYFKSLESNRLNARIITPVFKDYKNGNYKIVSFFAKKARGMMTTFIIKNRIENPEQIKLFDEGGYYYNDPLSEGDTWVFTRD